VTGADVVPAELLAYLRGEHERDALAALALLTWSESLRSDALAERLKDAFTEIHGLFATLLARAGRPSPPGPPEAGATATLLGSVFVGYVMQLATLPPGTADPVPGAVAALWGPGPVPSAATP
jgi:hypothetical protein